MMLSSWIHFQPRVVFCLICHVKKKLEVTLLSSHSVPQTVSEAFREANLAASFGKAINFWSTSRCRTFSVYKYNRWKTGEKLCLCLNLHPVSWTRLSSSTHSHLVLLFKCPVQNTNKRVGAVNQSLAADQSSCFLWAYVLTSLYICMLWTVTEL